MNRAWRGFCLIAMVFVPASDLRAPGRAVYSEAVLAIQVHLDCMGFRPGVLDGKWGRKTKQALDACLRTRGAKAAEPTGPTLREVTIIRGDLEGLARTPKTWPAKSRAKSLPHQTVVERLAERFHASEGLLRRLNPDVNFRRLKPGDTIRAPNVADPRIRPVAKVEILLSENLLRAWDNAENLVAQFPCSVAKRTDKRPVGMLRVTGVVKDPTFRFDPRVFTEVRGVNRELIIPPGPNNPVGTRWIGLSKPGYGIHGTPEPSQVGITGSHGCFRLTNWDAQLLADIVLEGTPVEIKP